MFPGNTALIGHARIQQVLTRMIAHNTLPHAFLFVGPRAIGKTTVAQVLIRHLLGSQNQVQNHPDYQEVQRLVDEKTEKRKTSISVKQIRELTVRLGLTSLSEGWKIVFFEQAQYLSQGAANALLKTLEEPKGKTLFIFCTTHIDQVPATIASRCQIMRFNQVSRQEIGESLVRFGFSPVDAVLAASMALGRPGKALRFLKDSLYRSQWETSVGQALAFFSASLPQRLAQVMTLIPKTDTQKNESLLDLLDHWELVCRDVLFRHLDLKETQVFPQDARINSLVPHLSVPALLSVFERLNQVRRAIPRHVNPHLALEHITIGF